MFWSKVVGPGKEVHCQRGIIKREERGKKGRGKIRGGDIGGLVLFKLEQVFGSTLEFLAWCWKSFSTLCVYVV